jgi:hypothetical protein
MEIDEKQSRQLDEVLRKLLSNHVHATSIENINKELFPNETFESCLSLFYILKEYYPPLLYPESELSDDCFWAREYVTVFLNEGGFSRIYDIKSQEIKRKKEKELLELEKLKYDTKNASRIYKTYWWTFGFALIALLVSLYNLLKGLF